MNKQPDYIQWHTYNSVTEYIFYYGVPDGRSELLAEGATFDCVYSPSPNQRHPHWRKVRFQVTYKIGRTNEWERWYTEIQRRELTADEITQFEALIAEIVLRQPA